MTTLDLLRLYSSFLIIVGGQLIIFKARFDEMHRLNEKDKGAFNRFENWMNKLNIAEYIILMAAIYPTFCILVRQVFKINYWLLLPTDNCYYGWYLVTFIIIIFIQLFTKLNIDYNRKNMKKLEDSLKQL